VWKGAWTISQLLNNPDLTAVGIDPYPGMESIQNMLKFNLDYWNVGSRFSLYSSVQHMPPETSTAVFSLIHIDGVHSEVAVKSDLSFANNYLSPEGIIVVDDIYHPEFPGIASAAFQFLHSSDFAAFALTENKMYMCRKTDYPKIFLKCKTLLQNNKVYFSEGFTGIYGAQYLQSNAINGYQQLVVRPNLNNLENFYNTIGLRIMPSPNETFRLRVERKLKLHKIKNKLKHLF
jgi:hypothetical protein